MSNKIYKKDKRKAEQKQKKHITALYFVREEILNTLRSLRSLFIIYFLNPYWEVSNRKYPMTILSHRHFMILEPTVLSQSIF